MQEREGSKTEGKSEKRINKRRKRGRKNEDVG